MLVVVVRFGQIGRCRVEFMLPSVVGSLQSSLPLYCLLCNNDLAYRFRIIPCFASPRMRLLTNNVRCVTVVLRNLTMVH